MSQDLKNGRPPERWTVGHPPLAGGYRADWAAVCQRSDVLEYRFADVMDGQETVALVVQFQRDTLGTLPQVPSVIEGRCALIAAAPEMRDLLVAAFDNIDHSGPAKQALREHIAALLATLPRSAK